METKTDSDVTVIEIHPDAKYVIQLDESHGQESARRLMNAMYDWMAGDDQFFFVLDSIKLVRIDK